MHKLQKIDKNDRNFYSESCSGGKKQIDFDRGSSNTRYIHASSIFVNKPFDNEIGLGAHDMNYLEVQEIFGIEEENEVKPIDVDENGDDVNVTPRSKNVNVQSESINLPSRPSVLFKKIVLCGSFILE